MATPTSHLGPFLTHPNLGIHTTRLRFDTEQFQQLAADAHFSTRPVVMYSGKELDKGTLAYNDQRRRVATVSVPSCVASARQQGRPVGAVLNEATLQQLYNYKGTTLRSRFLRPGMYAGLLALGITAAAPIMGSEAPTWVKLTKLGALGALIGSVLFGTRKKKPLAEEERRHRFAQRYAGFQLVAYDEPIAE